MFSVSRWGQTLFQNLLLMGAPQQCGRGPRVAFGEQFGPLTSLMMKLPKKCKPFYKMLKRFDRTKLELEVAKSGMMTGLVESVCADCQRPRCLGLEIFPFNAKIICTRGPSRVTESMASPRVAGAGKWAPQRSSGHVYGWRVLFPRKKLSIRRCPMNTFLSFADSRLVSRALSAHQPRSFVLGGF